MAKVNSSRVGNSKALLTTTLWVAFLIPAIFSPAIRDAFNAPKSWILSILAALLLPWIVLGLRHLSSQRNSKIFYLITLSYFALLIIAFIFTDNKFIGFFGEYQRRTGLLTYLSLIIIFVYIVQNFRFNNFKKLSNQIQILSLMIAAYGFFQHFNIDFIDWHNPYNSVISTLGNPDFAAAVMALLFLLNVGILIDQGLKKYSRIFSIFLSALLFIVILFSNVRQGLVLIFIGLSILGLIKLRQTNLLIFRVTTISFLISTFVSILGMLNKGPLSNLLYKTSISYRGDYWRASLNMIKHNPFFGVGLDRFGANFRTFRDTKEVLRRGPDLVSNAAHNVPLQITATGGILLGTIYLIFCIYITWRGWILVKMKSGNDQLIVGSLFATWVAYLAQSLISIDNIGISVIGYVVAGVIVAASFGSLNESKLKNNYKKITIWVSLILATVVTWISLSFLQSESAMHQLDSTPDPTNQSQIASYLEISKRPISYFFKEPTFEVVTARHYAQVGNFDPAITILKNQNLSDKKSFESRNLLAQIYEYKKEWNNAAKIREGIAKIDPYNQANLLMLGIAYKNQNNTIKSLEILQEIKSISILTPEAIRAEKELSK